MASMHQASGYSLLVIDVDVRKGSAAAVLNVNLCEFVSEGLNFWTLCQYLVLCESSEVLESSSAA